MTSLRRRLEPLTTPIFRAYWRLRRPMTLGVRGVALDADGRVCLVRHTYVEGWYLPGGGVEHGETAEDALARELAEEAGVALDGPPELVGIYCNAPSFPNDHVLLYRITRWKNCAPHLNGEISDRGFFSPDALPEGTTPATRARLQELFRGQERSAYW